MAARDLVFPVPAPGCDGYGDRNSRAGTGICLYTVLPFQDSIRTAGGGDWVVFCKRSGKKGKRVYQVGFRTGKRVNIFDFFVQGIMCQN